MFTTTVSAVVVAFLASFVLTMGVRSAAPRLGLVDRPDGHRKLHKRPIALGGGIAILLATVCILTAVLVVPNPFRAGLRAQWLGVFTLLLASTIVVLVGIVDDVRNL